jgi:hypothetical protein
VSRFTVDARDVRLGRRDQLLLSRNFLCTTKKSEHEPSSGFVLIIHPPNYSSGINPFKAHDRGGTVRSPSRDGCAQGTFVMSKRRIEATLLYRGHIALDCNTDGSDQVAPSRLAGENGERNQVLSICLRSYAGFELSGRHKLSRCPPLVLQIDTKMSRLSKIQVKKKIALSVSHLQRR